MASSPDNTGELRRWLELYREDCLYKVLGKSFTREKSLCVTQMISDGRGSEVLEEVQRCHSNASSMDRRTLFFAIALCTKSQNAELKAKAGKTLLLICRSPRELFTYLKMLKTLSTSKGFGRSIKSSIQSWYNQQDPVEFMKMATRFVSYNGYSHRDVLRLTHVTPANDRLALILKYLVQGFEEAKKEFDKEGTAEDVRELFAILQDIHSVKHTKDKHEAARLIEKHSLKIEHIATQERHCKEMLDALLCSMNISEMLENLPYFAVSGFLEDSYKGCADFIQNLKNESALKEQNTQPFDVYVALELYEFGLKGGKKKSWEVNPKVRSALQSAFEFCIKSNITATNKRYLISVRVGSNKKKTCCRGSMSLSSSRVTAAVVTAIARKEDKVDLVYFTDQVTQLTLSAETQLRDLCDELATQALIADTILQEKETQNEPEEDTFKGAVSDQCDMTAPIRWAMENKKKIDVFLSIVDTRHSGSQKVCETLQQYRKEMNLPKTMHICLSLTFAKPEFAKADVGGMLDISGFDKKVPRVIQKFINDF